MRLSLARLADLVGEDVREVKKVDASKKGIQSLDDLSACVELERLDLSHNNLKSLEGIADCCCLKWLNVASNQLEHLTDLKQTTCLTVLNASANAITSLQPLAKLKALQALILSSNSITAAIGIESLIQLTTLVLSKNKLEDITVSRLTNLEKLSLSHNEFHSFPDVSALHSLKELRLNNNKISHIPESIYMNARLVILDIGNNRFRDFKALQPLCSLRMLTNLNLKGNHVCTVVGYVHKVVGTVQHVMILDGKRLAAAHPVTTFGQHANTKRKATKQLHTKARDLKTQQEQTNGDKTTDNSVRRKVQVTQPPTESDALDKVNPKQQTQGSDNKHSLQTKTNKYAERRKCEKQAKRRDDLKQDTNSHKREKQISEAEDNKKTFNEATESTINKLQHSAMSQLHGSCTSKKIRKKRQRYETDVVQVKHKKRKPADRDTSFSENPETNQPERTRRNLTRQSVRLKGKSALKTKASGVVSIKDFHTRRGGTKTKLMSSTFEPHILLQSMQDFGVGGLSAW
ncbi:uncharacterized protein LOC134184283 isoform X1 [Corticium candelabrum]|uniref:uncharacterized protein LOC134184283 isoform X1 n=1 Tax=Corticium candelabrum TaxID=121492 RepID=UPI002E35776C|nr:uncharacterized protein LOC134184283 isoform X1 [Corticium candelabrum]